MDIKLLATHTTYNTSRTESLDAHVMRNIQPFVVDMDQFIILAELTIREIVRADRTLYIGNQARSKYPKGKRNNKMNARQQQKKKEK